MSIKHRSINWMDGMKLSSTHFKENDAHHNDQLTDSTALFLNRSNYGLLPSLEDGKPSINLDLKSQSSNRVEVWLNNCNAVTPSGTRILLKASDVPQEGIFATVSASEYAGKGNTSMAVIISANHYLRIPVGAPDPEESPLRHPYTLPRVTIDIVPTSHVSPKQLGGQFLVVGKLAWADDRFVWEANYVPPCTVVTAHTKLVDRYNALSLLRDGLRTNAIDVLQKTMKAERHNKLAQNTRKLCSVLLNHLALTSFSYKNEGRDSSPIFMVKDASVLANLMSIALYQIPTSEKEELLTYYYQWTDVPPRDFEGILSQMCEISYDHQDMMNSLDPTRQYMMMISKLWEKLSDLKYIGHQKESIVIRQENIVEKKPSKKFGFFK